MNAKVKAASARAVMRTYHAFQPRKLKREIVCKKAGKCAQCGAPIPEGSRARWYPPNKLYGIGCHEKAAAKPLADILTWCEVFGVSHRPKSSPHPALPTLEQDGYRVELHFPKAPQAEFRTKLKAAGFLWDPDRRAWYQNATHSVVVSVFDPSTAEELQLGEDLAEEEREPGCDDEPFTPAILRRVPQLEAVPF
jgi:hypothetical protein